MNMDTYTFVTVATHIVTIPMVEAVDEKDVTVNVIIRHINVVPKKLNKSTVRES